MNFKNLPYSTVATAPSPATSGTSLVVAAGEGARFPQPSTDGSFWATAFPPGENPHEGNAEIVQVTARSTDTLTIVRAQRGTTAKSIAIGWIIIQGVYAEDLNSLFRGPEGIMYNGRIVPSVTSNNLTVALKGADGNDPSPTNPVFVKIGNVVRVVTASLSVAANAATNWFGNGSVNHAALERDYFAYLGYNTTDGVVIGFAQIPQASIYSDFSATSTAEKYCRISTITNAAAGDNYVVIGRFAATLSAAAGHNWSVPTFTNKNLIQRPIYSTRWLTWTPTITYAGGSTDPTSVALNATVYRRDMSTIYFSIKSTVTRGTGNRLYVSFSSPAEISSITLSPLFGVESIVQAEQHPKAAYTESTNKLSIALQVSMAQTSGLVNIGGFYQN